MAWSTPQSELFGLKIEFLAGCYGQQRPSGLSVRQTAMHLPLNRGHCRLVHAMKVSVVQYMSSCARNCTEHVLLARCTARHVLHAMYCTPDVLHMYCTPECLLIRRREC